MGKIFHVGLWLVIGVCPAAAGCSGSFKHDAQGYAASEGGAEPTGAIQKMGQQGEFLYFDIMDGKRYYALKGGDDYNASDVALQRGCTLPRLRPGGKYQ